MSESLIACPHCGTRYAYAPAADWRRRRKPDGTVTTVCAHVMCDGWRDGEVERVERERRVRAAEQRKARAARARELRELSGLP